MYIDENEQKIEKSPAQIWSLGFKKGVKGVMEPFNKIYWDE